MNRSRDWHDPLLPEHSALQHERAPRPLPLFLQLVRIMADADPALAAAALDGLAVYEQAERPQPRPQRPEIAREGPACLRDHGGSGRPVVLVPSLINPPHILDLDEDSSLAAALAAMGRRVLLLDWGRARGRGELSVSGHVEHVMLPLIRSLGEPAALIGYCLGGTMAIAAANLIPVERLATLAAPWRFSRYPADARSGLDDIWRNSEASARTLGALPMEVLQAAFWSLDPQRTVAKFAKYAALAPGSAEARRFVQLEDWANEGEALPYPAARELFETLFADDATGGGRWTIMGHAMSDAVDVPTLHLTADRDRIAPAATAPRGDRVGIASGHVGMVVGSSRTELHEQLRRFLA